MARLAFNMVFLVRDDGSLEPRQRIRVGGVTFGPGVRLAKGVSFGGIDFTQFQNHDLEIETDKDVLVIKGIYKNG